MYYIVQENTFREENYDTLIHSLERGGLEYEIVKVLPFTDEIEFKTDRKDIFVFGSLKLARIAKNYNWNPGSLSNKNHDYEVYSQYYQENLLNYDSIIQNFTDEIDWNYPLKFIRPSLDTKTFTGKVFTEDKWKEFVHYSLTNGHETSLCATTKIQVASPKWIQKEIRLWIIDGEVITGSQYRLGDNTIYSDFIDPEAIEFAERMIKKFELAKAFVMDVCLVDNKWKIVEVGCINSAGFYKSNLLKVFDKLEECYSYLNKNINSSIDGPML